MTTAETEVSSCPAHVAVRGAMIGRESLNIPNFVTATRLVLAVVLFAMISVGNWWITSACLFVIAASTDALDGYLARRYRQITVLGRILDPFVDKVIVCGAFIFLIEHNDESGPARLTSGVSAWMVMIIIGREMFVSSLRGILEKEGKDFSASFSGKLKMALQCCAVTVVLLSLSPHFAQQRWVTAVRDVLLWLSVLVTVWSGAIYLVRGFTLLRGR